MKLLDLFCGAGGAAMGYYRAGITDITGIDINPQPRYPFKFIQGDALEFVRKHGKEFDIIHASPPCQKYSEATPINHRDNHPDLIAPTRRALKSTGKPYVIENVENARGELIIPVKLCGTMLGLPIWRHRYFETWPRMFPMLPPCLHSRGKIKAHINGREKMLQLPVLCTGGSDSRGEKRKTHRPRGKVEDIRYAMEIDWMVQSELTEAIPPAYTEFIAKELFKTIK